MEGQTMRERLSTIEEAINGNGKDGLKTEVALIKKEQEDMNADLKSIATSISALARSQHDQDAIEKHSEENKERRTKAVTTISIVLGIVFGSVSTLYLVLNHIG